MPLSPAGRVAFGATGMVLLFGVLLALIGWGLSVFWAGPRPLDRVTPEVVVGEWSAAGPTGEAATARLSDDATFAIEGMPDDAFCAGGPHRISDADWRTPESIEGTWELTPSEHRDDGFALRLEDDRGCVRWADVEADADARYLVLWIGWMDEGAADLRFRTLDGE